MRDHDKRLERLELRHRNVAYPYVIRVCDPPTAQERAQMAANTAAGKPFAVVPHVMTTEAWSEKYGSRRN